MLKKTFIALICLSFFAFPAFSQEKPYQDLLDQIQSRHSNDVPQMPKMAIKQPFTTGMENSPILKLYEKGWFPAPSNRQLPSANPFTMTPSTQNVIVHNYYHYDTPDPVMTLITTPIHVIDPFPAFSQPYYWPYNINAFDPGPILLPPLHPPYPR